MFGASRARPRLEGCKELRRSLFAAGDAVVRKRSRDQAGANAIDANLVLGKFDRSRASEADYSGLGGAVCVQSGRTAQSGDRGGRDDRAAAGLTHLGHGVLDAEEYRAQEDREAAVPIFRAGLLERPDRAAETGVVIDDVEASEFLDRAIDRALDVFFAGYVGELEYRVAAVLLAVPHRSVGALAIEIGNHDRGAFACESNCGGAADSARRTGDNCNLLF